MPEDLDKEARRRGRTKTAVRQRVHELTAAEIEKRNRREDRAVTVAFKRQHEEIRRLLAEATEVVEVGSEIGGLLKEIRRTVFMVHFSSKRGGVRVEVVRQPRVAAKRPLDLMTALLERVPPVRLPKVKKLPDLFDLAAQTEKLAAAVRRVPAFKNVEFQCVDDYDKCIVRRGGQKRLCQLALLVCILRRIVPLVK